MEQYGKILLIAMPAFLMLVLFEKWYGWRKGKDTFTPLDMVSSLTSGVTNVTKDVLGLSFTIITYAWLVDHLAIVHIKATWLTYVLAFIVIDFAGYWIHRFDHEINFFWNAHIVHHSSEEFNLACALRQSISVYFKIFTFLLIPAAILGVPKEVINIVTPLHLFAQFWYHTRHIGKMGFLEKFIVTPSHHRVHHAINPEYMDKNLGQIFIFWDKWFGTFQEELENVPPVYGVTRPVRTWNPIKINFQHLFLLIKDAWRTSSIKDKFRIWFMPTGWRPKDVEEKFPVYKIQDVYHFEKYNSYYNQSFLIYVWAQLIVLLLLLSYLFANIAAIGKPDIFLYGLFVFVYVYALTEMMDHSKYALVFEAIKSCLGISFIAYYGHWFKAEMIFKGVSYFLIVYFVVSFLISFYFVRMSFLKDSKTVHS